MSETPEARLKRMAMRSWRRGTKEMDLILGPFADARLAGMGPEMLALYDALLAEADQDIYPWITGAAAGPPPPPPAPPPRRPPPPRPLRGADCRDCRLRAWPPWCGRMTPHGALHGF
jgi:antitoxin CptB